jgi:glc operon protein GlcG
MTFGQHHDAATKKPAGESSMRTRFLIALGVSWVLALGDPAVAQQPPPPPPPASPTPRPDYGPPITNEQAKAVAGAALAEAKKNNWRMAISIVGPAGELVYFEKMDGTQLASTEISQGKARTAVMFRLPSKAFADQCAAGNTVFMTFPEKPVASEGGIPIIVSGKIIGAIGASGGTGQQDGTAAAAGANAAK